jgi:glycosyltransferase involved in cell wall biosynthesis
MTDAAAIANQGRKFISIITPAYNEEANLSELYERLKTVLGGMGLDWEWVIVDDHSADETYSVILDISKRDNRVRGIRLSRNFGSHAAISCGLKDAKGEAAVILAADLQDPPEIIPELIGNWQQGFQVVWAVRGQREGENRTGVFFSRLYYWVMREVAGLKEIPARGADFFLIDRRAIDAFFRFDERNVSILSLIAWMGFRQKSISYDKKARLHGESGWTLGRKIKLLVDSLTSFTFIPLRVMSVMGILFALTGFIYAAKVIADTFVGIPVQGWASLMVAVLMIGGILMLMVGVLGEYLWRALEEIRNRPQYLIEESTGEHHR